MGRPVRKDINGTEVFGTFTDAAVGIKVQAFIDGSLNAAAYILKQKGSRRYKVTSNGTDTAVCKLINTTPSAAGEMLMMGSDSGTLVPIKKLQKRTAIDFDGNRYTWVLQNDSSVDYIELTPIA